MLNAQEVAVLVDMNNNYNQYKRLIAAFSNQFCLVNNMASLGKDTASAMCLLKKLYLAIRLYDSTGFQCDINCFILQNT